MVQLLQQNVLRFVGMYYAPSGETTSLDLLSLENGGTDIGFCVSFIGSTTFFKGHTGWNSKLQQLIERGHLWNAPLSKSHFGKSCTLAEIEVGNRFAAASFLYFPPIKGSFISSSNLCLSKNSPTAMVLLGVETKVWVDTRDLEAMLRISSMDNDIEG
eukprot:scaffold9435_cov137-Cylindrotheca_fusiformis.AAC.1